MDLLTLIALSVISIAAVVAAHRAFSKKKTAGLSVPCLPSVPYFGSMLFMPFRPEKGHSFLARKAKELGSVFAFYAGRRYTIVLNNYDAIYEALVRKSLHFAGRSPVYTQDLINVHDFGIVFKRYGESYKRNQQHSVTVLKHFGFGIQHVTERRIQLEATELINYMKGKCGKTFSPAGMFEKSTLNVIYGMIFGVRLERSDPTAEFIATAIDTMLDSFDFVLDVFPQAAYLPYYRRLVSNSVKVQVAFTELMLKKIAESEKLESDENFVKSFVERAGQDFDRTELAFILRDLLGGGLETTATQLNWCLVELGNNNNVQKRLQEEIDSVVDRGRLPSLDDRTKLPYVEATILEVMRLRTIAPLAIPRETICDTEVSGYSIPKNTGVLANLWAAHRDPRDWPEPNTFRPERFLDEDGTINSKVRQRVIPFSLGKRSCTGEALARQELFLFLTAIVQHFDILPPEGKTAISNKIHVVRVLHPAPYELRLVPRL